MGYMLVENQNLDIVELSQILSESTHVLSKLHPDFEKIFQLDKILTSKFFELKGLLCFAMTNANQIRALCEKISRITSVCDNVGILWNAPQKQL